MINFNNRILFVGYGAVAQCALPMLLKLVKVPARNITVLDFEDRRQILKPWLAKGVKFVRARVTRKNLGPLLGKYLSEGDMLLDLAWNIGANDILQWCHDKGVLYLNASTELWDPYEGAADKHPTERTLYHRHMAMRRMTTRWKIPGPTAVIEHGANPGLISHFAKKGLLDIAFRLLDERKVKGAKAEKLRQLAMDLAFNELSRELGVKVIHVSERDTQISDKPRRLGEFVNT